ncbi:MAG: hypothetical protein EXR79_07045 [Myxococcales bacterium]|nr:hypothetical protein [Myxococcales bacterium]
MPQNLANAPTDPDLGPHLRVDVHDRSRIEWVATVPLAPAGETHTWEIMFEADISDAMWVPHQPWDHFWVRSRLTSPKLAPGHRMVGPPIDQLRRRALGAVHDLKRTTQVLDVQLRKVRARDGVLLPAEAEEAVRGVRAGIERARVAREAFDYLRDPQDVALEREQGLAAEYVSTQILLLVTKVAAALQGTLLRRPRPLGGAVAVLQAALHDELARENDLRQRLGFHEHPVRNVADGEGFVTRAALLKKHFQQALFLEASAFMMDQRMRNWIAALMAMVASTFYFVWQIYVLNAAMSPGQTTISLATAAVIAALVYAAKDRIKELGRDWLQTRLKHSYADRVAHLRLQERMDPRRHRLGLARETISVVRRWALDRLNPGLGRTVQVHHLRVRELLKHEGLGVLHDQGLTGLKHVFRYDLSPLFVKLDDLPKHVPVEAEGGVRTVATTRVYSIPLTVTLQRVDHKAQPPIVQAGVLHVRRKGLLRFRRHHQGPRTTHPALATPAAAQPVHAAAQQEAVA